jgi:hypothetical protein
MGRLPKVGQTNLLKTGNSLTTPLGTTAPLASVRRRLLKINLPFSVKPSIGRREGSASNLLIGCEHAVIAAGLKWRHFEKIVATNSTGLPGYALNWAKVIPMEACSSEERVG